MAPGRVSDARAAGRIPAWSLAVAAVAVVAAGALAVKWVAAASTGDSGPSLLRPPGALPAARRERPALMVARRAGDVLVGLAVRRGGPVDVTVVPPDMSPLGADAVRVDVGARRSASLTSCGKTCFRVAAADALRRPLSLALTVTRPGKPAARATFALPRRLPAAADDALRRIDHRMAAVRSFRVDETLSSGVNGIRARFLFSAPNRMSYSTSDGAKAVVIGPTRWDSENGGAWQRSDTPGVHVPSYMWAGAGTAHVLGTTTLGGRRLRVLSAFRPDASFPAWFRLYVRPDDHVVRAEMLAPAHFMVDALSRFDRPVAIQPPVGSKRPTVWDQMRPIGTGPRYQPQPLGAAAREGRPAAGLRCQAAVGPRVGAHLELFANERVVIVPAGIGIAPPHERDGAYVRSGRCSYAARTVEPTGVIQLEPGARLTLGRFFRLWGQPLSRTWLAGFRARPGDQVRAYVAGRRWRGPLAAIPLRRHAQVVLEVNGYVPPHSRYRFPPGL